jgi:hypothetical protein
MTFPKRRVSSLYFDSLDSSDLIENLNGNTKRLKLRLRWYDEKPPFQLELKSKNKDVVEKYVMPLNIDVNLKRERADLYQQILSEADNKIKPYMLGRTNISCWVVYDRLYYESLDGIRITLDFNIQSSAQVHIRLQPPGKLNLKNFSCLELKYPLELEERASEIIRRLQLFHTSFSKMTSSFFMNNDYL